MESVLPILTAQPAILQSSWWLIIAALGIPAAITGFFIRRLEKSIDKKEQQRENEAAEREKKAEKRERDREKLDLLLLQTTAASIALGEATARAVQRIPDAHCNGDMHKALEYAAKVKHDQKDFLTSLGIHSLHED